MRKQKWNLVALLLPLCALVTTDTYAGNIYLLGDVTPIYALTEWPPNHPVSAENPEPGNQELFLRFAGSSANYQSNQVLIHADSVFANAIAELGVFYQTAISHPDGLSEYALDGIFLLAIVGPNREFEDSEVEAVREYLTSGGSLLLVSEPWVCSEDASAESLTVCNHSANINDLLSKLGCSMRINPIALSAGSHWAMLADHPIMADMDPVSYGATASVTGGTPLMFERGELPMLSFETLADSGPCR